MARTEKKLVTFKELFKDAYGRHEYWHADLMIGLSIKIYAEMQKQKLSNRKLALKAGVNRETVSRLLGGDGVNSENIVKIAFALGKKLEFELSSIDVNYEEGKIRC